MDPRLIKFRYSNGRNLVLVGEVRHLLPPFWCHTTYRLGTQKFQQDFPVRRIVHAIDDNCLRILRHSHNRHVYLERRRLADRDILCAGGWRRFSRIGRHRVAQVAARIHLGLRHRVRACIDPGLGLLQLAVAVGVARLVGRGYTALRVDHTDAAQGHIPGIGQRESVGHHLVRHRDRGSRRALDHVDRRALADRDILRAGGWRRFSRIGRHRVAQVAARIHLGLRHRVRACIDPSLGLLQLAVAVGVAGLISRGRTALRVDHADATQGHVPGIGHRESVGHDLARRRDRGRRRALHHVDRRALADRDILRAGGWRRFSRIGCHRVTQVAARIHLGLRHRVRARVDPSLGLLQLVVAVAIAGLISRGRTALRVGHTDAAQGHIPGIGQRESVGHHLVRRRDRGRSSSSSAR